MCVDFQLIANNSVRPMLQKCNFYRFQYVSIDGNRTYECADSQ